MYNYLLAVDGSANAKRAAAYLANLTQLIADLDITVIHAVNIRREINRFSNNSTDISLIEQEAIDRGWQIINEQVAEFNKLGFEVKKQLINGDPAAKITEFAKLNNFSHIVLGSRGLTNLQGIVLGSVSHRILNLSHCPITLVK
ncbi:universal stress protein [Desulfotomaculum sp. 1211_IL3151]|uniref:universal stress protein n=1 Tax=Desulfotomaculum sp. 1211_IL3151 TaxID=3084055 RepID=UPI002FDA4E7C